MNGKHFHNNQAFLGSHPSHFEETSAAETETQKKFKM